MAGWTEDCELTSVEMGRAMRYLEAKSATWIGQQSSRSVLSESLGEGLRAYALRQAALQQALLDSFCRDFDAALFVGDGNTSSRPVADNPRDDDDYMPGEE